MMSSDPGKVPFQIRQWKISASVNTDHVSPSIACKRLFRFVSNNANMSILLELICSLCSFIQDEKKKIINIYICGPGLSRPYIGMKAQVV